MDFNKNDFLDLWRRKVPYGVTLDLEALDCFGYFEAEPYTGIIIRYNVEKVANTDEGIVLHCSTRVRQFSTGYDSVEEREFMRYAKEIRLHGDFPDWLIPEQ